jgi:hypothetical protein
MAWVDRERDATVNKKRRVKQKVLSKTRRRGGERWRAGERSETVGAIPLLASLSPRQPTRSLGRLPVRTFQLSQEILAEPSTVLLDALSLHVRYRVSSARSDRCWRFLPEVPFNSLHSTRHPRRCFRICHSHRIMPMAGVRRHHSVACRCMSTRRTPRSTSPTHDRTREDPSKPCVPFVPAPLTMDCGVGSASD